MRGYQTDIQSEQFMITRLYSKIKRRKQIELLVLLSCISFVGYIWVWILAIWWLWSFRRTDEDFIVQWKMFPQFEADFPFKKENFTLITTDWKYQQLLKRKNSIKIGLMLILTIPLYGYVIVLLGALFTIGIIFIFLYIQMKKPEKYLFNMIRRKLQPSDYPKVETDLFCGRCGKQLPQRARYCDTCAYPVHIPQQIKETSQKVSFRQAVDLLDSETYPRSARMNIEFECVVLNPASPEQTMGPAPHRKLQVTDPGQLTTRKLYIWGDHEKRHNIDLAASLEKGDRLLIIGPSRPKDDPRYYTDEMGQDVFWISSWDGTAVGNGTRLLKLQKITPKKVEEATVNVKKKDVIEFKPETPSIQQDMRNPPFYCQLCSIKHLAGTPRMQCDACGRFVCVKAFAEMAQVGRTNCPMCDGKLISV